MTASATHPKQTADLGLGWTATEHENGTMDFHGPKGETIHLPIDSVERLRAILREIPTGPDLDS